MDTKADPVSLTEHPSLPEPRYWWELKPNSGLSKTSAGWFTNTGPHYAWDVTPYFTADQMRRYAEQAVQQERARCATPPSLPETVTLSDEQIDAAIEALFPNDNHYHAEWLAEVARPIARAIESAVLAHIGKRPAMSEDTARLDWLEDAYIRGATYPNGWKLFMSRVAETGYRAAIDATRKAALSTAPAQPTGKTTDADGVQASSSDQGEKA